MRSPFKFLDSYSLKDKDAFFGRKKETDVFYEMVNKNRLLLVYGQSGSGKTSLVECGLANRFDVTDWYPIRVRRRQNINESLTERLKAILIEGEEGEDYELADTLTEQVEDIYAEYLRPVYLIFDQLEEVFILGDKKEQDQFIQSIAELYHSKIACRVIFILREEYLGHLYDFEKVIPSLFDRRLRVEVMNNTKVQAVLQKSFAKFNISLEDPEEERLKEMIANISGGKALIQLPYLQVYLDMLYREDYQRTYGDKERGDDLPALEFTREEIAKFGAIEEVLSKFLDFQEKEIQGILNQTHTGLMDNTVLQIMDAYVTNEGTKRPIAYTRKAGIVTVDKKVRRLFPPIEEEILSACFIELEKARIIRMMDNYMEVAHDSLAALLTQKRGAEQQLRKRLSAALQEYELSGGKQLLSETQVLGMADMLPKLYLDEKTYQFIEKSKKTIAEEKTIAKAAELRKTRIATIIATLGFMLAAIALWNYYQAKNALVDLKKFQVKNIRATSTAFIETGNTYKVQMDYEKAIIEYERAKIEIENYNAILDLKEELDSTLVENFKRADKSILASNKERDNQKKVNTALEKISTLNNDIAAKKVLDAVAAIDKSGQVEKEIGKIESRLEKQYEKLLRAASTIYKPKTQGSYKLALPTYQEAEKIGRLIGKKLAGKDLENYIDCQRKVGN